MTNSKQKKHLPENYQGLLLQGNYSEKLTVRVRVLLEALQKIESIDSPVIAYLAAWEEDKKIIWYEFIGRKLCDLLGCRQQGAADAFRQAVIDRRVYTYSGSDDAVEEEITTRDELGGKRLGLREEVKRSGAVEAVYKISAHEKVVWMKDQAKIENFDDDNVCLSLGFLTDVTKEMEQKDLFEKIGYFDELTRLPKRLIMDRIFEINIGHYCRSVIDDFVFLMIDVDHFKAVNDNFGHPAGDYVLASLAELMMVVKRKEDEIGRFGGEEFYGFSLGSLEHGLLFAERLRKNIATHQFIFEEKNIPVTVSIGIVAASYFDHRDLNAKKMVKMADENLYRAKQTGRNKVVYND